MAKNTTQHTYRIVGQLAGALQQALGEPPVPNVAPGTNVDAIPGLVRKASLQTASISASLALPGGITGLLTLIPEILAIWKIQAQLIANIAFIHGKDSRVTKEQMLWCMFRQVGYSFVKEFVFQQGSTFIVRRLHDAAWQQALQKVGLGLVQKYGTRWLGKIIPIAGTVSAGTLSYYDTRRAARRAEELYASPLIQMDEEGEEEWFV